MKPSILGKRLGQKNYRYVVAIILSVRGGKVGAVYIGEYIHVYKAVLSKEKLSDGREDTARERRCHGTFDFCLNYFGRQ